jgi:hypothetical protein
MVGREMVDISEELKHALNVTHGGGDISGCDDIFGRRKPPGDGVGPCRDFEQMDRTGSFGGEWSVVGTSCGKTPKPSQNGRSTMT